MSYVLTPVEGPGSPPANKSLAMLNYALLFFSVFFAGVPSIVAVAIAYGQKAKAPPELRRHFRFQIGLFWSAFFVALLAGALGLSGLIMALGEILAAGGASASTGFRIWELQVHGGVMVLMVCGAVLAAADAALLMVSSALGFIRLASKPGLSKSAA